MDTEELMAEVDRLRASGVIDAEVGDALQRALAGQANREVYGELLHTAELLSACIELENMLRPGQQTKIYPGTIEHAVAPEVLNRLRAELAKTDAFAEVVTAPTPPAPPSMLPTET